MSMMPPVCQARVCVCVFVVVVLLVIAVAVFFSLSSSCVCACSCSCSCLWWCSWWGGVALVGIVASVGFVVVAILVAAAPAAAG